MYAITSKRQDVSGSSKNQQQQTRDNTREGNKTSFTRENIRYNTYNLYGEETYRQLKISEKLRCKKAHLLCDLAFLRRCRDQQLTPTCCKLSFHTITRKTKNILGKASQALLRVLIQQTRLQLNQTDTALFETHSILCRTIHPILWEQFDKLTSFRTETDTNIRTERQKRKYERLVAEQKPPKDKNTLTMCVVHNISDKVLDESAINVLSKGFNFAVTPAKIPVEDIICGVESTLQNLEEHTAEIIRQEVSNVIRKAKPPKRNVSKEEYAALKDLRTDNTIVILHADKGNATVVMNKTDYEDKINVLLQDTAYKKTTNDPTTYLEKTTKAKINATPLDDEIKKNIIPREKSSQCPKFYGLPKIHKSDIPLRPIVSSVGSPTQALARFLSKQLQPYAERVPSYVKNADHFIEIIKETRVQDSDLLVSFDVVSLFTKVPIEEAVHIIKDNYDLPDYIINLISHCLKTTYFTYNSEWYKQIDGAPMGSPLSPVVANLFMAHFEKQALETAKYKPKTWLRYVDDTFVIWSHGKEKLHQFLDHLNRIHNKIEFTMEIEDQNQMPFLDILVKKKRDGTLGHTVYRKPTHTNRYLNAHSHHHPAQLNSVVKTLVSRSLRLADEEHKNQEINTIRKALLENGYTRNTINKSIRNQPTKKPDKENYRATAFLPYIKGTTDKISRILRNQKINTIFTTDRKINDILSTPKDKIPLESQGIYEIPCKECEKTYIGQTNRRINVRKDEHKLHVRNKTTTSSLAQHVLATGHSIDFENTKTIAKQTNFTARIIREAIEIDKRPHSLNKRDDTQRLPQAWKPLLINKQVTPQHRKSTPKCTDRPQNSPTTEGPVTRSRTRGRGANPNKT